MIRAATAALVTAALSILACGTGKAHAAWPERTVTIVVPFAAGGITDIIARLAAERLSDRLKQSFIVENVVGATGTIAATRVARSPADGYTLFLATPAQISIAPFTHNISYDPLKDLVAIAPIAISTFVITVSAKLPVNTLPELIEYAKARPGEITYGSAGAGSLSHLAAALFTRTAGIMMNHVPYKGVGPAFQDLVGGHIGMMSPSPVELKPFLGQGTLKPLAVTDTKRTAMVPGVPSIAEFMPSQPVITWNGLLAPAKTPREVIAILSAEMMAAGKDPSFLEKLEKVGLDPLSQTPEEYTQLIVEETARWRDIIRDLGLKATQ